MSKRKKKWTTKNTHLLKRERGKEYKESDNLMLKIAMWIVIATGFLTIIVKALNNHVVGYDRFVGMPLEWVRSLFD